MIICLYDSNYPVAQNEEPDYGELPTGYFYIQEDQLDGLESGETMLLSGTYIFANNRESLRPRIGEHLLAVFSNHGKRYVFNSTLSFDNHQIEVEGTAFSWDARLGLNSEPIKIW